MKYHPLTEDIFAGESSHPSLPLKKVTDQIIRRWLDEERKEIEKAVSKAVDEYGEAFKKLGEDD